MDVDELKSRVGIAQVVARYVLLRRQGNYQFGLCPFHSERTPSFTVSDVKRFYHCFGCGAHGDVLDFVMAIERIDFSAALARLKGEFGFGNAAETLRQDRRRRHAEERTRRTEIEERERRSARAHEIFESASPIEGTPAEFYLEGVNAGVKVHHWPA